jgi:hypothetical protein
MTPAGGPTADGIALPGTWAWPDGSTDAPPLSGELLGLQLLRVAQAAPGTVWLARAAGWPGFVQQRHADEPVPLALADFAYHLADGQPRRAFGLAPLLAPSFGSAAAQLRSRVVRWWLDPRFFVGDTGFPSALQLDAGDGLGPRPVPASGLVTAFYGSAVEAVTLTLHAGGRVARAQVGMGPPAPPRPDQRIELPGATAWVYLAPGRSEPVRPLIVCEGFPGGWPCDWLHDMVAQCGLMAALHARGHDVVLLGFADGMRAIDDNAAALTAAIARLDPAVVGGVSMGGLVARQALATLDAQGQPHHVELFFTLDTPHQGAYTPLSVQWFVHAYKGRLAGAAEAAAQIDSVANQQFMSHALRREGGAWQAGPSPLRTAWLERLAAVGGYPTRPRKLALACGRGDGRRRAGPGALQLRWDNGAGFSGALHALGGAGDAAAGTQAELPALPAAVEPMPLDGMPGSTNIYLAQAWALLAATGLQPQLALPLNLSIPTVSALDMAWPPDQPIPPDAPTPFDHWCCADEDLPHLVLSPALRDALLAALPPAPPRPAPTPKAPP